MVKSISNSKQRLMASVASSHTKILKPVPHFTLQSTTEFASRSTDVFSNLSSLESKHESWMSVNETIGSFGECNTLDPIQPIREEFKRPLPPRSSKQKKFFRRNSRKWIKYSLEDIPLSSDAANSAIAFQFLRDLQKAKRGAEIEGNSDGKVVFNKSIKGKNKTKENEKTAPTSSFVKSIAGKSADASSFISKEKDDLREFNANEKNDLPSVKLAHLDDSMDEE